MRRYLIIILSISLITIDQLSKYIVRLQGGFYICNSGVAFGIKLTPVFFLLAWVIIISLLFYALWHSPSKLRSFGLVLLLSGAISNILDRIYFSCVIDIINLRFWPASNVMRSIAGWPIFNLADVFITVGVILLLASYFRKSEH